MPSGLTATQTGDARHPVVTSRLRRAGLETDAGHGSAVALIQRSGSAARLDTCLQALVLEGVYRCSADGVPVSVEVGAPIDDELRTLLQTVIIRLVRLLTR